MRIKLLHILYSGQGGLGSYFMNFVMSDKNNKFIHYAFFYGVQDLYKEYEDFCVQNGIPYIYHKKKTKVTLSYVTKLAEYIRSNGITAIAFHTFSVAPAILYIRHVKRIVIDHTASQVKTNLEWGYTLLLYACSDIFVFFFEGQINALRRRFPFLWKKNGLLLLPKSVDTDEFKPNNRLNIDSTLVIGMSARLTAGKRFDIILDAVAKLQKEGHSIRFKVAGSGPLDSDLLEQAHKLDIGHTVEFLGTLSRLQMVDFYQSLNAYVHMTDGETVCYCIMEAQACGLPIIASDVMGVNNVLVNGQTALLVSNDADALSEAITKLISNSEIRTELSARSRELSIQSKIDVCDKVYDALK